jgi:predicted metal-dependent hydrolase
MFARLVEVAGAGSYPRRGVFGWIERVGRRIIAASDALSFLGMLCVEEVTDALVARILAAHPADPRVAAVCRIHRVEEARHMELARSLLRERRLQRLMLRNLAPLLLRLVFDLLVSPDVYRQAGIAESRPASWRLWWRCRRTPERRALCREGARRMEGLLADLGALDAQTRLVWAAVGLRG